MKKTNNVSKVLLVTLLVIAATSATIELSIWYFGVRETMVALGVMGGIALAMVIFSREKKSSKWVKDNRERMWHQQSLTEEAFRQKYCK